MLCNKINGLNYKKTIFNNVKGTLFEVLKN